MQQTFDHRSPPYAVHLLSGFCGIHRHRLVSRCANPIQNRTAVLLSPTPVISRELGYRGSRIVCSDNNAAIPTLSSSLTAYSGKGQSFGSEGCDTRRIAPQVTCCRYKKIGDVRPFMHSAWTSLPPNWSSTLYDDEQSPEFEERVRVMMASHNPTIPGPWAERGLET
jgi:hypothetical protein